MVNKKIALVSICGYPVPAVKGGAIETIETLFADENEKCHKVDFTIYSKYDRQAEQAGKKYKYTNFVYSEPRGKLGAFLRKMICKIPNHFGANMIVNDKYYNRIIEDCKRKKFDYIVFEEAEFQAIAKFAKFFGKDKIYFHIHSNSTYAPMLKNKMRGTISVSNYIRENWIKSITEDDADKYEHHVVVNAVDEDLFRKKTSEKELKRIRKDLGFADDDIVVLYLGRVVPQKGVYELAKAVQSIKNQKVKLLIIGNTGFQGSKQDDYYNDIVKIAENEPTRIKMVKYIPNSEIYKYCKAVDIRCFPAKWEEPGSLALIESLHCGTPLIITRSGGMPEVVPKDGAIIIDKNNDLVSELERAITKLTKSPAIREKMTKANLEQSKLFEKRKFYDSFVNIFK